MNLWSNKWEIGMPLPKSMARMQWGVKSGRLSESSSQPCPTSLSYQWEEEPSRLSLKRKVKQMWLTLRKKQPSYTLPHLILFKNRLTFLKKENCKERETRTEK